MRVREEVPFIQDLLFVHETRKNLDAVVKKDPDPSVPLVTQHLAGADGRCRRGHGTFHPCRECHRIPKYYLPEEITPAMYGRRIRIVGGPLNEYEGSLLTTRGSKVKRLLVELKGFLAVGVEVDPEYIQLI